MYSFTLNVSILILFILPWCFCYTPVVIWHGIISTCCHKGSVTKMIQEDIQNYLPGIYVVNIQIGNSLLADFVNSVIMHPDKQIEIACNIINSDPLLADGFNAIGVSQGAQLLRGVVQRCSGPKMKKLITMSAQHRGFYEITEGTIIKPFDTIVNLLLRRPYTWFIQEYFTLATGWHNPFDEEDYLKGNTFLPDLNNEKFINETYVKNLQSLEHFVMIKHGADIMITPTETQWFGYYKPGQAVETETLQESEIYTSDRLGLKKMDSEGKLVFLENNLDHDEYDWEWFRENVVDKYLK